MLSLLQIKLRRISCYQSLNFLTFKSIPGIDSTESIHCEKTIPLWNLFLETSIPQHISTMQTLWQSARDEKSIPAIKWKYYGTWPIRFHIWFLSQSIGRVLSVSPPFRQLFKNIGEKPTFQKGDFSANFSPLFKELASAEFVFHLTKENTQVLLLF